MTRFFSATFVLAISTHSLAAGEPASCDDPAAEEKLAFQYEMSESTRDDPVTLVAIDAIQDMGVGAPPEDANIYADASASIELSRYCEGMAANGTDLGDPIYWRVDQRTDDKETLFVDHCSVRHDTFEDGCLDFRPAEPEFDDTPGSKGPAQINKGE